MQEQPNSEGGGEGWVAGDLDNSTCSGGSEGLEIHSPSHQGAGQGGGAAAASTTPPRSMFSLKWNGFEHQVTASLCSLYASEELADVTLACDDGQLIKAHKVILALSSTFFRKIFKVSRLLPYCYKESRACRLSLGESESVAPFSSLSSFPSGWSPRLIYVCTYVSVSYGQLRSNSITTYNKVQHTYIIHMYEQRTHSLPFSYHLICLCYFP
jgi:hypothetical protein